ncbi:porin family protein [Planktosalinus lacus]|uniref:Membrane protein n=1 Tax=Planktosalinus lacus TaxID=1526573 RepID=A0A8J2Y9I3_9FLAO|nr:porin family protein [Planktosalinus lacus]GGD92218.1 membrane protein [Planktosalinus lacus]
MKKLTLIVAIAIFSFTNSNAQEFSFGVKGGVNVANFGGTTSYAGFGSLGSRTGAHIGVLMEVPISGDISLQPELLYSMKGSTWSDTNLDYIDIPILGKYNLPWVEGLSGELGPVIGVLMSAKRNDNDAKDSFKTMDAAIAIGATYKLNMGVFFSLRYNKGLLEVWEDNPNNFTNKNNVFQVSAGYAF